MISDPTWEEQGYIALSAIAIVILGAAILFAIAMFMANDAQERHALPGYTDCVNATSQYFDHGPYYGYPSDLCKRYALGEPLHRHKAEYLLKHFDGYDHQKVKFFERYSDTLQHATKHRPVSK